MDNWEVSTTGFSAYSENFSHTVPLEEKVELNEKLMRDLKDEYVGVSGVVIVLEKRAQPDYAHKEYFKALLKEDSLKKTLVGSVSFRNAYENFYFDHCQEQVKKSKFESALSFFKSNKLPAEDALFFDDLDSIQAYVKGESVENINEKIDFILNHRLSYEHKLAVEDRVSADSMENIKEDIMQKRYNCIVKEFIDYSKQNKGTTYMLSAIDKFIDNSKDIFNDFNIKVPMPFKVNTFNFMYNQYFNMLSNHNLPDYSEVIGAFNNLHEKIIGTKKEMAKMNFNEGKFYLEMIPNPYHN